MILTSAIDHISWLFISMASLWESSPELRQIASSIEVRNGFSKLSILCNLLLPTILLICLGLYLLYGR